MFEIAEDFFTKFATFAETTWPICSACFITICHL